MKAPIKHLPHTSDYLYTHKRTSETCYHVSWRNVISCFNMQNWVIIWTSCSLWQLCTNDCFQHQTASDLIFYHSSDALCAWTHTLTREKTWHVKKTKSVKQVSMSSSLCLLQHQSYSIDAAYANSSQSPKALQPGKVSLAYCTRVQFIMLCPQKTFWHCMPFF